jgi:hypothetical protein
MNIQKEQFDEMPELIDDDGVVVNKAETDS